MSKSSKTSLNNIDIRTWKTKKSIKLPKNSVKFNSSFDEFFEERLKQQEEMSQEKPRKQEKTLRKKDSLKTSSTSYGSEIDETTTRYLQGITLRKTTKGGKRRRTRKSRKTVRRRRR